MRFCADEDETVDNALQKLGKELEKIHKKSPMNLFQFIARKASQKKSSKSPSSRQVKEPSFAPQDKTQQKLQQAKLEIDRYVQEITLNVQQMHLQQMADLDRMFEEQRVNREAVINETLQAIKQREETLELKLAAERKAQQEKERDLQAKKDAAEKERIELQTKNAKEAQNKLDLAQAQSEKAEKEKAATETTSLYGSTVVINQFEAYLEKVTYVKQQLKPKIDSTTAMANEARRYRMQITIKVGAVTNSKAHLIRFKQELLVIFDKARQISSDLLYPYLLDQYAKAAVMQAMSEVSVNLRKAFPLATLTLLIAETHPLLLEYVFGRMYKECIYIVPAYVKRRPNETDEQLRLRIGYWKKNGALETEVQLWERMAGVVAFYAAITQADLTEFNAKNSYGPEHGWTFLARLLNMTPRKLTPTILETFLNVYGHRLCTIYGQQARKLIEYVRHDYINRIKGDGTEGARVRLQLLLDECVRKNYQIEPLEGSNMLQ